jgi:Lactoylglutathione lyase and related lyases
MPASGIDHVNILTDDLDATARFYEQVLGLTRTDNPAIGSASRGAWMRDAAGNAIIHLVWKDPATDRYAGYEPGRPTNALHHVAFRCSDYAGTLAVLDAMAVPYRVSDREHLALRQVFLTDPNAINVELNFTREW